MTAVAAVTGNRARLPYGFTIRLGDDVRAYDRGRTLFGGSPARLVYLKPVAQALLADRGLTVVDHTTAGLARLLLDRGLAEPVPAEGPAPEYDARAITVVIPVKDRTPEVARLLASLPGRARVIVVDDGSADPEELARVVRAAGAVVLRHPFSRGPSAARNTGLRAVSTPLVAFVDSDVVPRPGWLDILIGHLADPTVGIVAPRIAALDVGDDGVIARYEAACSSLDLGSTPALVSARSRVSYVPSACLVGRVEAFGAGFDEAMQVAEDVDLVWRATAAGWRVRYEPASVVEHEHRTGSGSWLRRKAFYGTGAAPLAQRHPGAVAPVVLSPWTAVVVTALVSQRRWSAPLAAGVTAGAIWRLAGQLRQSDHPVYAASRLAPYGVVSAAWQCSAAATRHWWPVAVPAAIASRRVRRLVLAASVVDGLVAWRRTRPELDPVRFVLLRRADDLAYGAGLWWGALKHRTTGPLRSAMALSAPPADPGGGPGRRWPGSSRRGTGRRPR